MNYDLVSHTDTSDSNVKKPIFEVVKEKSEWGKIYVAARKGIFTARTAHELNNGDVWVLVGVDVLGDSAIGVTARQVSEIAELGQSAVMASLWKLHEAGYVERIGLGKRIVSGKGRDAAIWAINGKGKHLLREVQREMSRIGVKMDKVTRKNKRLFPAIEGGFVTGGIVRSISLLMQRGELSEYLTGLVQDGLTLTKPDFDKLLKWLQRQDMPAKEKAILDNCDRIKFIGVFEGSELYRVCERVEHEVGGPRRFFRYYIRRGKFTLY
jgi:hypothetical protein